MNKPLKGGIGHNQGPPLDDIFDNRKLLPETDKQSLSQAVASISGGSVKHGVDHDDHSGGDASGDKPPPRTVVGVEDKWAAGHTKIGGKHVAADGLLSRGGYRRIISGATEEEVLWVQDNTWKLQRIASVVLRGRDATIFEKHVLNPLHGLPKMPVEELASQFGIAVKRVYKIIEKCRERIRGAWHGELPSRPRVRRPPKTVWENGFEFWVHYDEDGTPTESRMSDSREAKPPWREPVEKWKLEEQQRVEKLRERIKLQAEARMNKQKESK